MSRDTSRRGSKGAAIATCAAVLLLAGCAPFGTSKAERVERFEADLNYSRAFLYENFLESETLQYATIRDELPRDTWDLWFPVDYPDTGGYTISVDSIFENPISATVDGPEEFGGPKPLKLHLVRSGLIWYLERLTLDGADIVD